MSTEQRFSLVEYPRVDLRPANRATARFLINGHYSAMFGPGIRHETPRTVRLKIIEIEAHLPALRDSNPDLHSVMARQCIQMERVCALLEVLQ